MRLLSQIVVFFPQHLKKTPRKVTIFSKADWDAIRAEMSEFSDDYFCSCEEFPVDGKWTVFKACLAQLVNKYVTSKTLSTRYRVPWLTNVMKRLSRKKKRLYTRASRSHGKLRETLWSRYKTCKAEYNKGIKQAKEQFVNNISSAFDDNDTILADIFNCSLSTGILPRDWKSANVAPVFKKWNTNLAENYRPISLMCVCCKIFEHILCHSIRAHLDNNAILPVFQHGLRSGFSCDSQLLSTVHDFMSCFDRNKQVDVPVLDFSNAFDVVPHQRLHRKLRHCGIDGLRLAWIERF